MTACSRKHHSDDQSAVPNCSMRPTNDTLTRTNGPKLLTTLARQARNVFGWDAPTVDTDSRTANRHPLLDAYESSRTPKRPRTLPANSLTTFIAWSNSQPKTTPVSDTLALPRHHAQRSDALPQGARGEVISCPGRHDSWAKNCTNRIGIAASGSYDPARKKIPQPDAIFQYRPSARARSGADTGHDGRISLDTKGKSRLREFSD